MFLSKVEKKSLNINNFQGRWKNVFGYKFINLFRFFFSTLSSLPTAFLVLCHFLFMLLKFILHLFIFIHLFLFNIFLLFITDNAWSLFNKTIVLNFFFFTNQLNLLLIFILEFFFIFFFFSFSLTIVLYCNILQECTGTCCV